MTPTKYLISTVSAATAVAATLALVTPALAQDVPSTDAAPAESAVAKSTRGHERPKNPIVAHRGAPRVAPEETLASYQAAIDEGAAVLEGDVQLTADGELVLVHDDTLDTTTDAEEVFPDRDPWMVGDLTLEEIKRLDAGSWVHEKFAGERIVTVEEVLQLARGKVGFNLEMKAPENSPGVATKLADLLREYGYDDDSVDPRTGMNRIAVHSRDEAALQEFASVLPEVPISWLSGGEMLDDARLTELAPWTVAVYATPRVTTAADIDRAHAYGLKVYSDPVDSVEQIEMALNQGYDYIVTNVPEVAGRVVENRDPRLATDGVAIDHVLENAPGADNQPENGEYVALRNTTAEPIDISNHTLTDHASNIWLTTGPDAVIQPGGLFRVYLASGTNRDDAYYNGHTADGMFNNSGGDTAYLMDEDMNLLDVFSYIRP